MAAVQGVAAFLEASVHEVSGLSPLILDKIQFKARQYAELESTKLMLQVNLEHLERETFTNAETRTSEQIASSEEFQNVRKELDERDSTISSLRNQLSAVRQVNDGLESQVKELKGSVETLRREREEAVQSVERKIRDMVACEEQMDKLQSKRNEDRKEINELQNSLQSSSAKLLSFKIRDSNLSQELELTKKNSKWLESELQVKSKEFSEFRKEKSAQIAHISNELETSIADAHAANNKSNSLQSRLESTEKNFGEALSKIKELQDQNTVQQESFQAEINSIRRLSDLYERSSSEARARVEELTRTIDVQKERHSDEITQLRGRLDAETAKHDEAQAKISEMRRLYEELQNGRAFTSIAGDRNGESSPLTPGNRHKRSSLSNAQLITENQKLHAQVIYEQHRNSELQANFDDLIQDLESRAPEIQEQRVENSRMQNELARVTEGLLATTTERDNLWDSRASLERAVKDESSEKKSLKGQIKDLSRQVVWLVHEIELSGSGRAPLSASERAAVERALESPEEYLNDTDSLISQRLAHFRNIAELQEKNLDLLTITRQLGEKMEAQEEKMRSQAEIVDSQALEDASNVIDDLRDRLEDNRMRLASVTQERDLFRQILHSRTEARHDTTDLGESRQEQVVDATVEELTSQLQSMQEEFTSDITALNSQLQTVMKEKSNLQIDLAKQASHNELVSEREKMTQNTISLLKSESEMLSRRNAELQQLQARQEGKTQEIISEIVDVKSSNEGLRIEVNALNSELALARRIEKRLEEENSSLVEERIRLNGLLTNLQSWRSDMVESSTEQRRKLESQIESLEFELRESRKRLGEETDESRRLRSQIDLGREEERYKYDTLHRELAAAKETLVSLRSDRDNLSSENSRLLTQLESLGSPRGTPAVIYNNGESATPSRQTDLQSRILLRDRQLHQAQERIKELQEINAGTEESLNELSTEFGSYRTTIEAQIKDHENTIASLEERLHEAEQASSATDAKVLEIREEEGARQRELVSQVNALIAELDEVRTSEDNKSSLVNDLRNQLNLLEVSQQNYEREVMMHAETAHTLTALREQHNALQLEARKFQREAQQKAAALERGTGAWDSQREQLERELEQSQSRCADLIQHNETLHKQFENMNIQLAALEKGPNGDDQPETSSNTVDDLREVIKFLRREKEVADCQVELASQESRRLRLQVTRLEKALEETREQLQSKSDDLSDPSARSGEHHELLDKINELNILRESNSVLRTEKVRLGQKCDGFEADLKALRERIDPLEEEKQALQSEVESRVQQEQILLEDTERWKNRAQQLMLKYDRIDPEEYQKLKDDLISKAAEKESLQKQVEEAERGKTEAEERTSEIAGSWKAKVDKLVGQSKERLAQLRSQVKEAKSELESKEVEVDELNSTVATLQQEIEELRTSASTAPVTTGTATGEASQELSSLRDQVETVVKERDELQSKIEFNAQELQKFKQRSQKLVTNLRNQLEQKSAEPSNGNAAPTSEEVERLVTERMAAAEDEFEARKTAAVNEALEELRVKLEGQATAPDPDTVSDRIAEAQKATEAEYQRKIADMLREHEEATSEAVRKAVEEATKSSSGEQKRAPSKEQLRRLVDKRVSQEVAKQREQMEKETAARVEEAVRLALAEKEDETSQHATENPVLAETAEKPTASQEELENPKAQLAAGKYSDVESMVDSGQDNTAEEGAEPEEDDVAVASPAAEIPGLSESRPETTVKPPRASLLPRGRGTGVRGQGRALGAIGGRGTRTLRKPSGSAGIGKRTREDSQASQGSVGKESGDKEDSPIPAKKRKEDADDAE